MTRSCFATSASRAAALETSREMGVVFLTPSESFFADSRVRQAGEFESISFNPRLRNCTNKPTTQRAPIVNLPTVVAMPASARTSRQGLATKPEPRRRTFLLERDMFNDVVRNGGVSEVESLEVGRRLWRGTHAKEDDWGSCS